MDVIQPELIWIDSNCFRKNALSSTYVGVSEKNIAKSDFHQPSGSCML